MGLITELLFFMEFSYVVKGLCSSMVTERLRFWLCEFNVCLVHIHQIILVYLLYLLYTLTNTWLVLTWTKILVFSIKKNQKTNSCSIQHDWDTDKVRTVPVLCSWLLYTYAVMVWRELLMFLVYYNRRVSIKTPVQRKTSSWEQVVKSKLKCLVGALGKSSRAGGLFWPGAGSPELPSCATSHTARAREQHMHCSWGVVSLVQPRYIRLNLCSRRICLRVMSPGCLKWISSIMQIKNSSVYAK